MPVSRAARQGHCAQRTPEYCRAQGKRESCVLDDATKGRDMGREEDQWAMGHPSQAEGEDPDRPDEHPDLRPPEHPSQAEGEDPDRDADG